MTSPGKCCKLQNIFLRIFKNSNISWSWPKLFKNSYKPYKVFQIFFWVFENTSGLPGVAKYISNISTIHTRSPKLQNIYLWIFKHSRTSWSFKNHSEACRFFFQVLECLKKYLEDLRRSTRVVTWFKIILKLVEFL